MDSIISKLSEVESAAELIVQHAEEQKHILDEQMKEKTDKFDRELAADTEKKLSEIRAGMQGSMDYELERLREESAKTINAYKREYELEHERYAQEIIKRITEV